MELLGNKEKRVLGALYRMGNASISQISKQTLINRTALYHTINELIKKGLVAKINREGGAYFQSLSFSEYETWAKRQIETISKETNSLKEWLKKETTNQLTTLYSDIKYFEGREGIKNLYSDSWRDNKNKIIYAITDYDMAYGTMGEFFEKEYFPDRISNNVRVKSLLPKGKMGQKDIPKAKKLLRDMRFVDIFKHLGMEMNIYEDKISIVAFDKKRPTGVIIKNSIIANSFKEIFQYLWNSAGEKVS